MAKTDDPLALFRPRLFYWFWWYGQRMLRQGFHGVRLLRGDQPTIAAGQPLILYTNHPSWWDPMVILAVRERFFAERRPFGPIDQEALDQYGFVHWVGAFGITRDRAGAKRFLHVGERVLRTPGTLLGVTAQGHFIDAAIRPLRLQPGIAHLACRVPGAVLLPLALDYRFWDERTPEALTAFGAPITVTAGATPRDVHAQAEAALTDAADRLLEAGTARDPHAFEPLMRGRVGIGGPVDLFRRARAALRGERFDAAHTRDRS